MEFITFGVCLTVIVGLILYTHHRVQCDTAKRVQTAYDRAADFHRSALEEIRAIRAQEVQERTQAVQERTNIMGLVSNCLTQLQRSNVRHDEEMKTQFEQLAIDLVQQVGHATADALGHARGEPVSVGGAAGK